MAVNLGFNKARPLDIEIEEGYRIDPVVTGLSMPTGIAFDDFGNMIVAESGVSAGSGSGTGESRGGRLLMITPKGTVRTVADGLAAPVLDVGWFDGFIYISEGGYPGRIGRVAGDGEYETLIDGLPTAGDHKTGSIAFGPDGRMYFPVGTATNSGVVGCDNMHWVKRHPGFHDMPSFGMMLHGYNYRTTNPLGQPGTTVRTGAFRPFGQPGFKGEGLSPGRYCAGAIYRAYPDGSGMEVYAHGLRNPFGLRWIGERLYATDSGMEPRGSRPITGDCDYLWAIGKGAWYGWPDYAGGRPVSDLGPSSDGGPAPKRLLLRHPPMNRKPLARFDPLSLPCKFDVSSSPVFGHCGSVFLALFGGREGSKTAGLPGHCVVRLNLETGTYRTFLKAGKPGAKSVPCHPIQAVFSPSGNELYLVDYGRYGKNGPLPRTGGIYRVARVGQRRGIPHMMLSEHR